MNNLDLQIQAGSRFISSEMQELSERMVFLIPNWKWIALVSGLILLYFVRHILVSFFKKIKKNQTYFKKLSFMHFLFEIEIEKPLSWIFVSLGGIVLIESLELSLNLDKYLGIFFRLFLSFNLIRLCYYTVEAFGLLIQEWAKKTETHMDDQLAPLATKSLKVLVVIVGVLIVLQNFNVNVTALLAGLGLGGVALAFAAQDTVANIFGTITILLDKPFKMGDRIRMGDTEGIVEEVGFRSTRIRTLYNSLVTLPNSVVAKEKIDNLSNRDGWIRFRHVLGVTYDATPDQMKQFSEHLTYLLLQDPKVDRERISITFNSFGDSSLNILVNFHFHIDDDASENSFTQKYLEMIYAIIQQLKLEFAFPTRTMIVQNKIQPVKPPAEKALQPPT
ncbi:MAG: mechanosensitive ion channel [Bdellovibrio sp.]|nr:mechanosensitive ion channel [Bdellovibrio sp.]